MTIEDGVRGLGRSLAQVHLKLGGLQESVDRALTVWDGPTADGGPGEGVGLEVVIDLLDALDEALARRPEPVAQPMEGVPSQPHHRGFFGRIFGGSAVPEDGARCDESASEDAALWHGLALASATAHERLGRQNVEPIATSGPLDPALHRVVDTVARDAGATGPGALDSPTIERTLRRGWYRRGGATPKVLRVAQVIART